MAMALQMRAMEMAWRMVNASRKTITPTRSWSVGARYWRNPIVESRRSLVALLNHSRGNVVTTPAPKNKRESFAELPKAARPWFERIRTTLPETKSPAFA